MPTVTYDLPDTDAYHPILESPTVSHTLDPLVDFPSEHTEGSLHDLAYPLSSYAHRINALVSVDDDVPSCAAYKPEDIVITIGFPGVTTITGYYGLDFYKCDPQSYTVVNASDTIETHTDVYPFLSGDITQDFRHITEFRHPVRHDRTYTYTFSTDTDLIVKYVQKVFAHPQIFSYWHSVLQARLAIENTTPFAGQVI